MIFRFGKKLRLFLKGRHPSHPPARRRIPTILIVLGHPVLL